MVEPYFHSAFIVYGAVCCVQAVSGSACKCHFLDQSEKPGMKLDAVLFNLTFQSHLIIPGIPLIIVFPSFLDGDTVLVSRFLENEDLIQLFSHFSPVNKQKVVKNPYQFCFFFL